MAKTNKYASLNFNDLYENKISKSNPNRPSSSPSSSSTTTKTVITNSRIHGNMLVLTRPSPKPIAHPPQPPPVRPPIEPDDSIEPDSIEPDSISLRPLGRTGTPSPPSLLKVNAGSVSPKSNKFVPPHLRPGFRGKEEKPDPEVKKQLSFRQNPRPKSGGGYDRDSVNRPRSSGANRPVSSG